MPEDPPIARPSNQQSVQPQPATRRHPRHDVRLSAEVRLDSGIFTATTRNVSEGGAGLECDRPLPEGGELVLGLFLVVDGVEEERVPPLWVKGRVAWCGPADDGGYAAGIRFEVITAEQKAWLRRLTDIQETGDDTAG